MSGIAKRSGFTGHVYEIVCFMMSATFLNFNEKGLK